MSLFCWQHRRAISRAAVLRTDIEDDPALKRHLSCCADCRTYLKDMSSLAGDLMQASAPKASPMFVSSLHERLTVSHAPSKGRQMALVPALAASLFVLGVLVWRMVTPTAPSDIVKDKPWPYKEQVAEETSPPTKSAISQQFLHPKLLPNRELATITPVRKGHLRFVTANTRHEEPADPPAISRSEDARRWKECGLLLEAGGEARLAEAAYHASYNAHPTMQAAFDVGRSAEASGDTDQALDIYADLLASTDTNTNSVKGNNP